MTREPTARRVLFGHFLRHFASFEATATGGEAKHAIIAVVSLLAAPGYLTAVAAARGSRATWLAKEGKLDPSLWLWREEWLLLSISLVVVAVVVSINWRALVLGCPRFYPELEAGARGALLDLAEGALGAASFAPGTAEELFQ